MYRTLQATYLMKPLLFTNSELPRVRMEGTALTQEPVYMGRVFAFLRSFSHSCSGEGTELILQAWASSGITPLTLMRRRKNCLDKFLILVPPAVGKGTSKFTLVIFLGDVTLLRT